MALLRNAPMKPALIIVAGITGSGTMTTLKTLIDRAAGTGEQKLYSVEDPLVEYEYNKELLNGVIT